MMAHESTSQKAAIDAGFAENETATTDSSDGRHDMRVFAQKMEPMPVGYAQDSHGELPGVHEHVCMGHGRHSLRVGRAC